MSDDFDLDDDFGDDFDDFGSIPGAESPDDNRKPITRVTSKAVKTFASMENGMAAASVVARKSLPTGYSNAFDTAKDLKGDVTDIYDKTLRDLAPSIKVAKGMAAKAIPAADKILPKALADKFKKAISVEDEYGGRTQVDPNDSEIAETLKSIFEADVKVKAAGEVVADAKTNVDREIKRKVSVSSLTAQNMTATGISRIVGYQDGVLSKYHRKSLELQHRQYFAARDLLAFTKASNADMMAEVKTIVHNTGLPDAIKLRDLEAYSKLNQDRLVGFVQDKADRRLSKIPGNIRKGLASKSKEVTESIQGSLDMFESMSAGEGGPSTDDMAGDAASSFVTKKLTEKYGPAVGAMLGGMAGVKGLGNRLQFESDNVFRKANTKVQGAEGGFLGFMKDLMGSTDSEGASVVHDLQSTATESRQWDNISRRTLIEIIPGYLSRQLQQLTNIATGKENDRVVFDSSKEEFSTITDVKANLKSKISGELGSGLRKETTDLINSIDSNRVLSKTARTDLAMQLTRESANLLVFDPVKYSNPANIKSSEAEAIAAVIAEHYGVRNGKLPSAIDGDDKYSDRLVRTGTLFNKVGGDLGNYSEDINKLVSTGDKENLRELGVLSKSGDLDSVSSDFKWNMIRDIIEGNDTDFTGPIRPTSVNATLHKVSPSTQSNDADPFTSNAESMTGPGISNTSLLEELLATHANSNRELLLSILGTLESQGTGDGTSSNSGTKSRSSYLRKAFEKLKGMAGMGFKLSKFTTRKFVMPTFKLTGRFGGASLKQAKKIAGDIFVKGNIKFPALSMKKLEAREYFDKETGKAITKLKDIKGEVVDRLGNVVLTQVEFDAGLIYRTGDIVKGLGTSIKDTTLGLLNRQLGISGTAIEMLKGGLRLLNPPRDIYVSGGSSIPRLRKVGFVNGEYFSATSKKVLTSQRDIDGPVVDKDGNVLVSEKDIEAGLVNVLGIPITLRGKLRVLGGLATGLKDRVTKAYTSASGLLMGKLSKGKSILKGKLGKMKIPENIGGSNILLGKILMHLQEVFPSKRAGADADGNRIGGFRALQKRRREEADSITAGVPKPNGTKGAGILGKLGKLKGMFSKNKDGDSSLLKGLGIGALGSTVAGYGSAALASAGGALSGVGASIAGLFGGASASAGAAAGAGAAASSTATTAALVSNPVGWAILAGAGIYAGYKATKYLSRRTDLEPIEKLRFLQYGIPIDNSDAVVAIRYLEDELDGEITIKKSGEPKMSMSPSQVWEEFAGDFGADADNPTERNNFVDWFKNRFLPVFVSHKAAAMYLGDVDVLDVDDDLDNKTKATYVSRVQFGPRHSAAGMVPYAISSSPWPDIGLVDNADMIASLTKQIQAASARNEEVDLDNSIIDKKDTKVKSAPTADSNNSDATAVAARAALAKSMLAKSVAQRKGLEVRQGARNSDSMRRAILANVSTKSATDNSTLLTPTVGRVSSPFGTRTHPIRGGRRTHKGIDIAAPQGTPVYASASGIFDRVGYSNSLGNVIYIKHDDGRSTRYAHMSAFGPGIVAGKSVGKPVLAGELIGFVGSTGNSTGPHLHFEYRENDGHWNNASVLNPIDYFESADADAADTQIAEATTPNEKSDADAIGKPIVVSRNKEPKIVDMRSAFTTTKKDTENRLKDVEARKRTLAGNKSPIVNVAAPDLDGLNKSTLVVGEAAATQRAEHSDLVRSTNEKLDALITALGTTKGMSNPAVIPVPKTKIRPVVDLSKNG